MINNKLFVFAYANYHLSGLAVCTVHPDGIPASSLVQAPELPATTLVEYCYNRMFVSCTKLNYVKALFTDISAEICLTSWLFDVSETGTFVKNASATWTNEQAGIPTGWTVQTASPDK